MKSLENFLALFGIGEIYMRFPMEFFTVYQEVTIDFEENARKIMNLVNKLGITYGAFITEFITFKQEHGCIVIDQSIAYELHRKFETVDLLELYDYIVSITFPWWVLFKIEYNLRAWNGLLSIILSFIHHGFVKEIKYNSVAIDLEKLKKLNIRKIEYYEVSKIPEGYDCEKVNVYWNTNFAISENIYSTICNNKMIIFKEYRSLYGVKPKTNVEFVIRQLVKLI